MYLIYAMLHNESHQASQPASSQKADQAGRQTGRRTNGAGIFSELAVIWPVCAGLGSFSLP